MDDFGNSIGGFYGFSGARVLKVLYFYTGFITGKGIPTRDNGH